MRKSLFIAITVLCFAIGVVNAGNPDYLSNRSANYLMNCARSAATDAPDIVTYNPAGLTWLDEGFHLSFGNQMIFKNYSITADPWWDSLFIFDDTTMYFESTKPTYLLPDMYAVYRTGDLALFGAFTVVSGGGGLDYPDGFYAMSLLESDFQQKLHEIQGDFADSLYWAKMDSGYIHGTSMGLAGTAGISFAVSDEVSLGVAGRYVNATSTYDGEGFFKIYFLIVPDDTTYRALDVEKTAEGFGGIFSINVAPSNNLNLAFRYETPTRLEYETRVIQNDWVYESDSGSIYLPDSSFMDGYIERKDLPAMISGGMEYRIDPNLTFCLSIDYYFATASSGSDDDYGNGWDLSAGLDCSLSEKLDLGFAWNYSENATQDSTYNDFDFSLNSSTLCGGLRYTLFDGLAVTAAGGNTIYFTQTGMDPFDACTYRKNVWSFAFGTEISF